MSRKEYLYVGKGNWSAGVQYVPGNIVKSGSYFYCCVDSNYNKTPPNESYWNIFARVLTDPEAGAKGDPGYTPIKGVDYFDGTNGTNGTNGINGTNGTNGTTPVKGVDYFDGVNGAQTVPQLPRVGGLWYTTEGIIDLNTPEDYIVNITRCNVFTAPFVVRETEIFDAIGFNAWLAEPGCAFDLSIYNATDGFIPTTRIVQETNYGSALLGFNEQVIQTPVTLEPGNYALAISGRDDNSLGVECFTYAVPPLFGDDLLMHTPESFSPMIQPNAPVAIAMDQYPTNAHPAVWPGTGTEFYTNILPGIWLRKQAPE